MPSWDFNPSTICMINIVKTPLSEVFNFNATQMSPTLRNFFNALINSKPFKVSDFKYFFMQFIFV